MGTYFLRRLLQMIPTIIGVLTIVFLMIRLVPGCPAYQVLGDHATPERVEVMRERLGLDVPMYQQYIDFMSSLTRGDLGTSLQYNRPVAGMIARVLPHTVRLAVAGMGVGVIIGVVFGIVAALNRNKPADVVVLMFAMTGVATPSFWLGLMVLYVFAGHLGWFPLTGAGPPGWGLSRESLYYLVLPGFVIGSRSAGQLARMTRSCLLEVLDEDYIRTARSKGLPERSVVYKHALRNAMIPVITVVGMSAGFLLGGSVLIETVFARPGLGKLLVDSIFRRDYPIVQSAVAVFSLSFMAVNLAVDLTYAYIDPRIRYN